MPELPEVENVRRTLAAAMTGLRIVKAQLARPELLRNAPPARLSVLRGERIAGAGRIGKYVFLEMQSGRRLVFHLRMTGRLVHAGAPASDRHRHFVLHLADRRGRRSCLSFSDARRFGFLLLLDPGEASGELFDQLGPDALAVSVGELRGMCANTQRTVKALLLDQRSLAGIGNIYADEILHRARIHPATPADRIPAARLPALHAAMGEILRRAIARGGSSVRDYVDGEGQAGSFQLEHAVYDRQGHPCPSCGTAIRRSLVAGRGTAWCPVCQPPPRQRKSSVRRQP